MASIVKYNTCVCVAGGGEALCVVVASMEICYPYMTPLSDLCIVVALCEMCLLAGNDEYPLVSLLLFEVRCVS